MKRNRYARFELRVPWEIGQSIYSMAADGRSPYSVVRDIVIAYVQAVNRPPLRDDTMALLYQTVDAAQYDSADELVQDLCRSLERTMRAIRGELHEGEAEVDNDIQEMFDSVLNEKEITVRKHT